jgi:hypothetical protein
MSKATPVIPITFAVIHDGGLANVTLSFADNADVTSSTRWRVPNLNDEAMRTRAADAREFALLAAKRWRHYRDTDTAALSLAQLRQMIADDPLGEYCFHLKVTADWFPASLGGAMVRRTWSHHLMIDFLFMHPQVCSRMVNVKSIGFNLLRAICLIADTLRCKRVWGEATEDSSAFYQSCLGGVIEDMFSIEEPTIQSFATGLDSKRRIA